MKTVPKDFHEIYIANINFYLDLAGCEHNSRHFNRLSDSLLREYLALTFMDLSLS